MIKISVRDSWHIFFLIGIVFEIFILYKGLQEIDGSVGAVIVQILTGIFCVAIILFEIYVWSGMKKVYVRFHEAEMEYSDGTKKYKNISYSAISKVQYVMRPNDFKEDYSKRGIPYHQIKNVRGHMPYYDVLDYCDNVLCTINVLFIDPKRLDDIFLTKGIEIEECARKKIQRGRLTGENILELQLEPMHDLNDDEIRKYIYLCNKKTISKNSLVRNLFIMGIVMLILGVGLEVSSFSITSIFLIVVSAFLKLKNGQKPLLNIENAYQGGNVFWCSDQVHFIVYACDNEIQRENVSGLHIVEGAQLNSINFGIKREDGLVYICPCETK